MIDEVVGTVVGRWYVTLFGITFLVTASRHLGLRRTALFLGIATVVGALAENGSVRWGIPYTRYTFEESLRGDEVFLGDVPIMVPLSYCFMAWFAFVGGRMLAAGPYRTRAPRLWHEVLMGWMLAVWALWVLDPVSRLGEHFYLGDLFAYEGPGFWFGLPAGSQLGFALTAGIMVAALTWMDRDAPDAPVDGWRHHPGLVALLTFHGQVFHLAVVAFWIGRHGDVPEANTIGGAAVLMWVPVALMTAVHWSHLRLARVAAADPALSGARG
jgi:uncharacterized membrane protein